MDALDQKKCVEREGKRAEEGVYENESIGKASGSRVSKGNRRLRRGCVREWVQKEVQRDFSSVRWQREVR